LKDIETGEIQFASAEDFLGELKREFGEGDDKLTRVAELKKIEQEGKTIEEFVQEFKRAARESGYEERALVKEFKRVMNRAIRRKLIEVERPLRSIDQWYEHTTNLDRY